MNLLVALFDKTGGELRLLGQGRDPELVQLVAKKLAGSTRFDLEALEGVATHNEPPSNSAGGGE